MQRSKRRFLFPLCLQLLSYSAYFTRCKPRFYADVDSTLCPKTASNCRTRAGTTGTLSLDIEDNTNDDVYSFTRSATAFLNVEQFSQLIPINNNSGTVDVVVPTPAFLPPDDVADGFCGF